MTVNTDVHPTSEEFVFETFITKTSWHQALVVHVAASGQLRRMMIIQRLVTVTVNLSSVKKGRRASYFEGHMSDGTSRMRVVGFKGEQRKNVRSCWSSPKVVLQLS